MFPPESSSAYLGPTSSEGNAVEGLEQRNEMLLIGLRLKYAFVHMRVMEHLGSWEFDLFFGFVRTARCANRLS